MSWRSSVLGLRTGLHDVVKRNASTAVTGDVPPLHTLRALLRECTYLPDPQARTYLSRHIIKRFRAYQVAEKPVDPVRLQTQHQAAQSALNQLRRANAGEEQPLIKTLLLTYGRVGKRRWELMRPLLPAEGQDGKGAGRARAARSGGEDEQKPLPSLTPQLHTLLLSHARADPPTLTRRNPTMKNLTPDVPKLNSWMRPMPQSRVRNLTKRWYRGALERVLPPLPKQEWERLRSLAQGKAVEDMIVQRRGGVRQDTDGAGVSTALEAIVAGGRVPAQRVERDVHRITPRFMRKMWAKVFVQCPLMEWDGQKDKWVVIWGEHAL